MILLKYESLFQQFPWIWSLSNESTKPNDFGFVKILMLFQGVKMKPKNGLFQLNCTSHIYNHVVLVARISLTLSRHFSLSFIASGRSSGLHPVSSHSCWMYVRAGRPAFARPYVGVHKSTSLMSSSLLLYQCPACLVRLTVTLPPLAPTHTNFLLTMSLLTPAGDQLVVRGGNAHFFTYTRIRSRERRK